MLMSCTPKCKAPIRRMCFALTEESPISRYLHNKIQLQTLSQSKSGQLLQKQNLCILVADIEFAADSNMVEP